MKEGKISISNGLRIFFLIFFLSLLAVVVSTIYGYYTSKDMVTENVSESSLQTIRQSAEKLDLYLNTFEGLAQQIRMNTVIFNGVEKLLPDNLEYVEANKYRKTINNLLNSYRDSDRKSIYSIALLPKINYRGMNDSGGGEYSEMMRSFPGPSIFFDDEISLRYEQIIAADGEPVWFPTRQKGFFGFSYMPTITFGRLMKNLKNPDLEVVLVMEIKASSIEEFINKVDFGADSGVMVVDHKNRYVASTLMAPYGEGAPVAEQFGGDGNIFFDVLEDGKEYIVVRSVIESTGWTTYGYLPTERLLAEGRQMFLITAGSMIILGIVVLLAFVLSVRFIRVYKESQNYVIEIERQNKELAMLDKVKDQFLANTSHELRTPLNGIIGLSESLIDGATGKLSDLTNYNLAMIIASGRRLLNLVNDILDFSKIKEKEIVLQLDAYKLKEISDVVLTMFIPLANEKGLSIVNKISADLPNVMVDQNRLQQILYNLIGNALKFTESGSITLNARSLYGDMVLIEVTDTGPGIAPEFQERIFLSFEQGSESDTRKHGGTGLGLAVTKMLVERHGGTIEVQSVIGQGSTFRFSVPSTLAAARSMREVVASSINNNEIPESDTISPRTMGSYSADTLRERDGLPTVLIVDDEPVNLMVLENHLSQLDVQVHKALSGMEALKWIGEHGRPDIMLLDVMMPQMSGLDVCERLRQTYNSSELPIILLTAKNQTSDLVKGFEAGANDYLVKPFSKNELFARLRLHMQLADWNSHLEGIVKSRTQDIKVLLDNADQGFLSFGRDLLVRTEFSAVCHKIFARDISSEFVPDLLPVEKAETRNLILDVLTEFFNGREPSNRSMLLSLLPSHFKINERQVDVEFREILNPADQQLSIMMIISDITEKISLENQVKTEQETLKMVVQMVTRRKDCMELITSYRDFCTEIRRSLTLGDFHANFTKQMLMRTIHTFKGNFSQYHFIELPQALHTCEDLILSFQDDELDKVRYQSWLFSTDFWSLIQHDLNRIGHVLGDTFLTQPQTIPVNPSTIRQLEEQIATLMQGPMADQLLTSLRKVYYVPVQMIVLEHAEMIETLANKLDKSVYPLQVNHPDVFVDPNVFHDWGKTLVHIFRNAVDHGIEAYDERIMAGKDMKGSIRCTIRMAGEDLQIVIEDDGAGIDLESIKLKAFQKGMFSTEQLNAMGPDDMIQLIFSPDFSTKSVVTDISGRGFGLDAVRTAVEKLNGTITVSSQKGQGTRFEMQIPYPQAFTMNKSAANQVGA